MTNGVHSCLRLPADLAVVSFARSAFACVLTRESWPAEGAGAVLLASCEALTNAIEHGSTRDGEVGAELLVTGERADIRIVDQGRPDSSVPAVPALPPPSTAARGRGLIIISRLADDFALRPHGSGTEVEIAFLRHPGPATLAAAVAA
jgi:anti-sigma regulatory factor (Ser/Thr protein kinase)